MSAIAFDMVVERYADFLVQFIYEDANGKPIDLTGKVAKLQVRPHRGSAEVLLTLDDFITLGGAAGTIKIEADAEVTAGWDFHVGVYDLKIDDERFSEGRFRVKDGVTHA